jgi:hypothetical protein
MMFWNIFWHVFGATVVFLMTVGIWISLETQHRQSIPKEGGYE